MRQAGDGDVQVIASETGQQLPGIVGTEAVQTGNLGKVLGRISEYYEAQLTKKLAALSKLAEPVMLLVMGVIVGVLVSSLILPIFKLSRAVS